MLDANSGSDDIHVDLEADSAMNTVLHRAARFGHISVVKVIEKWQRT